MKRHDNESDSPIQHFVPDARRIVSCTRGSLAYGGAIEVRLDDARRRTDRDVPCAAYRWLAKVDDGELSGHAVLACAVYLVCRSAGDKFVIPKFDPERLFDLESFWFALDQSVELFGDH